MMDSDLLEILVCPACRAGFAWDYEKSELVCCQCGLIYPVIDGVPVLIVHEAR